MTAQIQFVEINLPCTGCGCRDYEANDAPNICPSCRYGQDDPYEGLCAICLNEDHECTCLTDAIRDGLLQVVALTPDGLLLTASPHINQGECQ